MDTKSFGESLSHSDVADVSMRSPSTFDLDISSPGLGPNNRNTPTSHVPRVTGGIHSTSTPVGLTGSTVKRFRRDDMRIRTNPFEKHLLEMLHRSAWSPSVFGESTPTEAETPPERNWSVEQISLLNPSQIEDSPSTHQDEQVLTPQTEAKAQRAISMFFSQQIVPSPSPKIVPLEIQTDSDDVAVESPITTPASVDDVDIFLSGLTSSLKRRKLNFTLSPLGTDDEIMDTSSDIEQSPRPQILHSPGNDYGSTISPRYFRGGMESPNMTPIRISRGEN